MADAFEADPEIALVEMGKGVAFVLVTGVGLFFGSRCLMALIARQYEKIEKQRRSIEELDRRASAGLLASAIGHDANNLLTAVRMSVDLLQYTPDPQRNRELLQTVSESLDELIALNRRLVRGGQADQPGELQLRCLKNESQRVLQFLNHEHPVSRLKVSFLKEGDCTAPLNRHLYFQVFLNLLTNVARHAGEGAEVRVYMHEVEESVVVCVEDNGPGVPEPERDNIFAPYYSHHPDGAGLGLASVRAAMHLHGGDIKCEASKMGGAKFVLTFPKARSKAAEPVEASA